jgi:regulator of replication initiation timing
MCHKCSELQREIEALRSGNAVLRAQNINLAVQNNNLRNVLGKPMMPITQDYLTAWEKQQEAGA